MDRGTDFWPRRGGCRLDRLRNLAGHAGKYILDNFSKTLAISFLMIVTTARTLRTCEDVWAVALGGIVLAWLSIFVVGISKSTSGVSYDANDVGVFMVMTLPIA